MNPCILRDTARALSVILSRLSSLLRCSKEKADIGHSW